MNVLKALVPLLVVAVLGPMNFASHEASPSDSPAAPARYAAETWTVDGGHSNVIFRVQHLRSAMFWGRFNEVKGKFRIDEKALGESFVEISIPAASVDAKNPGRDRHLKSQDFFAAKEFPIISFKSDKIEAKGEGLFRISGKLTMRGKSKSISFDARHTGSATVSKRFGPRCGYEAQFTIKRTDFGMSTYVKEGTLGDEVKLIVALEGMMAK